MKELGKEWAVIATYSLSDGKYHDLPGAPVSQYVAALREDIETRRNKVGGRNVIQARKKESR